MNIQVPDSSQAPVAQSMPLLPVLVASTADCVDMGVVTSGQAYAPTMAGDFVLISCCQSCQCRVVREGGHCTILALSLTFLSQELRHELPAMIVAALE